MMVLCDDPITLDVVVGPGLSHDLSVRGTWDCNANRDYGDL